MTDKISGATRTPSHKRTAGGVNTGGQRSVPLPAGHNLKWRCHTCGEIQKYWAGAERHADENYHHRIEVVFDVA